MTPAEQPTGIAGSIDGEPVFDFAAWLGRTIDDRYKIEQLLGQGGMGAVFLAEHVKLQKKVALKVILPQFAGNGEVAERFAREAMASAKLEHPHVASALDYGTLPEGGAYLVMQLARGRSLRKVLDEKKSGWRYACEIGAQVADALAAAHAAGIVHRDLKPENVMIEPREDGSELVKVLDFGIARVIDDASAPSGISKLTRVGTIIGTPGYMSPEQALGEPVDTRADLYALGVILWETCAGRELWNETEVTALVTKQLTTEPPRLTSIASDVPAELDVLVMRLLARDRNDRPERAADVQGTLKRLAMVATVERMSLSAGQSGSMPAMPATVVAPRTSLLSALPPELADRVGSIAPGLAKPQTLFAIAGIVIGFVSVISLASLYSFCARETPPTTTVAVVPAPPGSTTPREMPRGVEPPTSEVVHAPPPPAGQPAIPDAFAADFETLISDDAGRAARRSAAERLLAQPQMALPPVVWRVAQLEDESGCDGRREIVVALGAIGDSRALPALERLDHNRRGCGFFRSQDCYRCLRPQLAHALTVLRSAQSPAP